VRIFAGSVSVTISRELDTETGKTVAPGNHIAKRGAVHARQRVNAAHRFLVEIKDLLVRFAVGHRGNVDGEDVMRVETSPRSLQRDQCGNQHGGTGQQHEGCRNLRDHKDPLTTICAAGYANAPA